MGQHMATAVKPAILALPERALLKGMVPNSKHINNNTVHL